MASCSKCPAEIDNRRADSGTRVKRFIGKTNRVALPAGKPFYQYMNRMPDVPFQHNCKLLLFGIVSGQFSTARRTGIAAVKKYSLTCQKTALDDINNEWRNAWGFHKCANLVSRIFDNG